MKKIIILLALFLATNSFAAVTPTDFRDKFWNKKTYHTAYLFAVNCFFYDLCKKNDLTDRSAKKSLKKGLKQYKKFNKYIKKNGGQEVGFKRFSFYSLKYWGAFYYHHVLKTGSATVTMKDNKVVKFIADELMDKDINFKYFPKTQEEKLSTFLNFKFIQDGIKLSIPSVKSRSSIYKFTDFTNGVRGNFQLSRFYIFWVDALLELSNEITIIDKEVLAPTIKKLEVVKHKLEMFQYSLVSNTKDKILARINSVGGNENYVASQVRYWAEMGIDLYNLDNHTPTTELSYEDNNLKDQIPFSVNGSSKRGARKLSYSGLLTVNENLNFKKGRRKGIEIPDGEYPITLKTWEYGSRPGITIQIKLPNDNGNLKKKKIRFHAKKKDLDQIPATEGKVSYKAEDLNQPFNLDLNFSSEMNRTPSVDGTEICVHHIEWIPVYRGIRAPVPVNGRRDVTYHYNNYTTTAKIDLVSPNRDGGNGQFLGTRNESNKAYDFKGPCKL